jgi:general L-amino acid transport system permease protein
MSSVIESKPAMAKPPAASVGAVAWARQNLFSTWYNSVLSVLAIALILYVVPKIVDWAFISAVWGPLPPEVCKTTDGACWPFIWEKYRFILFGTFPYEQQWRPGLAVIVFMAMIGVSLLRTFWNKRLLVIWPVGLIVSWFLMSGGVLGLEPVQNSNWGGLPITLMLAVVGCVVAFPLSILLALGRRSKMPIIKAFCVGYIELIRGVPLVSVLFMASVMFPLFLPEGVNIDKLLRAQVAIIMFVSAYMAEVVRGGLQAVPKGQYEAGDALGLSFWRKMILIVLPQALKITIPPMVNTFIGLFKDTSLVVIVSIFDLMLTLRTAINDIAWRAYFIEGYVFVALIYFFFCFGMSRYSQWLEKQLHRGHKR